MHHVGLTITETAGLPVAEATTATGEEEMAEAAAAVVEPAPTTKVEEAVTAAGAAAVDTVGLTITEHAWTCCTWACPLESVTGVNVTSHISTTGPFELSKHIKGVNIGEKVR